MHKQQQQTFFDFDASVKFFEKLLKPKDEKLLKAKGDQHSRKRFGEFQGNFYFWMSFFHFYVADFLSFNWQKVFRIKNFAISQFFGCSRKFMASVGGLSKKIYILFPLSSQIYAVSSKIGYSLVPNKRPLRLLISEKNFANSGPSQNPPFTIFRQFQSQQL